MGCGCYDNFYFTRCPVCEARLRDNSAGRRIYCRPPNKCSAEARKWPTKYAYPSRYANRIYSLANPHEMGTKIAHGHDQRGVIGPARVIATELFVFNWFFEL
jgi:hypothetical protein